MSNGEQIEPPECLRKKQKKLTQEQKRLSRKKKRSGKRNKQRIIVAKVHRKIRNQRTDFAHKTSRRLVDTFDRIVFEDMMILTKSKAECAGKVVEFVYARNTSQKCSGCGNLVPKDYPKGYTVVPFVD